MIKNLRHVFENINDIYDNIHYRLDENNTTDERLYFTTTIESQFFKGKALVTGIIEKSGMMNVIFTFGEIEENKNSYDAINEFNKFAAFAKAYIGTLGERKLLEVRYSNCLETEDAQAVALYKYFFDDMLNDEIVGHLTPMVALTK